MLNRPRSTRTLPLFAAVLLTSALLLPGSAGAEPATAADMETVGVWSALRDEPVPLVYRASLQVAWGAAWGNGKFYIADMGGGRFVSVAPDGTIDGLGISELRDQTEPVLHVAFDAEDNLHVADGEKVYRVNSDGSITDLGLAAFPNGGMTFAPNGDLYVAESHTGRLYRLRAGDTQLIASGIGTPLDLTMGKDGYLYAGQSSNSGVVKIDPATGTTTEVYDGTHLIQGPPYLTADAEGDLWLFMQGHLLQISTTGTLKPFTVDGVTNDGHYTDFWWALPGGVSFDDEGNLWATSYNGSVIRLTSQSSAPDHHDFVTDVIVFGFAPTDLAEASDGSIFAHNWMTGEMWRFSEDGSHETVWTTGPGDWVDFAAHATDPYIFVSTPSGEIITLDASGNTAHHAWLASSDLITMPDGSLVAVQGSHHGGAQALVRITGPDQIVPLTTELAGESISKHEVRIEPAASGGVYAFSRTTRELFRVEVSGASDLIVDFDDLDFGELGTPYLFTAGPDGAVFPFGYHEWRLTDSNQVELIALNTVGDPDAAVVSRDGSTLYVGEIGRISAIPLRAYDGSFSDDDGSVFESDVEWLAAQGITRGCNPPVNDMFCPNKAVTRGQMAAFLHRALDGIVEPSSDPIDFTDDDDSTFVNDIAWLSATGITKGCTATEYCPDKPVTRGQMAAFLVRAMGYTDDGDGNLFTDDDDSIFESDIDKLATAGVTRGCNPPVNDRFCPGSNVTRGQMAAFLHRALG